MSNENDGSDFEVIGPECFASPAKDVISWKGENFYKACDEPVVTNADGSGTHCVKRQEHPGDIHEDYDGIRKTEPKGRVAFVITIPLAEDMQDGYKNARDVMDKLKKAFAEQEVAGVQMAVREVADQLIMILEGDG